MPGYSRAPSRSAPTPIPISRSSARYRIMRAHPRSAVRGQPSGRHRHQIGAGLARSRYSRAMANADLVKVALSVTTLDPALARAMEPRASTPQRRLDALRRWPRRAFRPRSWWRRSFPALNDMEIERILERAAAAGVARPATCCCGCRSRCGDLFEEWLKANFPDRANALSSLIARCAAARITIRIGASA